MHEVSKAINILDPNKDVIDKAICKTGAYNMTSVTQGKEATGKCGVGGGSNQPTNNVDGGLSLLFKPGTTSGAGQGGNYHDDQTGKMGTITSGIISKDVSSNLNRDQKGVVSSAFAKAHEGAE